MPEYDYPDLMRANINKALERSRRERQPLIIARTDKQWQNPADHFVHAYPEIFLQIEGVSEFQLPGEVLMLKSGQTLIVPAGVAHWEICHPSKKGFLNIVVMLFGNLTQMHMSKGREGKQPTIEYAREYLHDVQPVLYPLVDSCIKVAGLGDDFRKGLCRAVWAAVEQLHARPRAAQAGNPKISLIMNLVCGRLDDADLSIKTIARDLGYNPDYLSHLFRRETGDTFSEWLCRQRMTMAQKYLRDSPLDISQISRQCGYNDPSYFTSVFSKRFDMSPRKFRRRVQGRRSEDNS